MNPKLLFAATLIAGAVNAYSQTDQELKDLIFRKDSLFWVAYNSCDIATMESMLSEDVEFYHDKGGQTNTRDSLMSTIKKNLCSNKDFRLRREPIAQTVKVFPLRKNDVAYGAIISGEHLFYINQSGKKEFLDGHASFSQLWILNDGKWSMTRILSYDHHAAEQNAGLKEINLPAPVLNKLAGKYKGPHSLIDVANDNGKLRLTVDNQVYILKAASSEEFYMTDRDLRFIFSNNKLTVLEHGDIVEEAVRQ